MDSDKVDIAENLNWVDERRAYTQDSFAAKDIMAPVIEAMEQATAEGAAQDARQQSALQNAISSLNEPISDADVGMERAKTSLRSTQNRLDNTRPDTDLGSLQNAMETAAQLYESSITRQTELAGQRQDA